MLRTFSFVLSLVGAVLSSSASAQGLIWSLPEDGKWVRFEGTYQQTELRPNSNEGPLQLEWVQHITIKSVGKEDADFKGQKVPCR